MISGFHVWLALIVLYLIDSIRVTTRSAVLFRRRIFSAEWLGSFPFLYPGNGKFGWTLASLLPGAAATIIVQDFVLAMDERHIAPNTALVNSRRGALAFAEISGTGTDDRFLTVNGSHYVYCDSASDAQLLRECIDEAFAQGPASLIRSYLEQPVGDGPEIFNRRMRSVRILSGAMWLLLFLLLPIALWIAGNDIVLIPVAGVMWLLAIGVAIAAALAKKRIYRAGRFPWEVLKYIFYPVAALRAEDDLAQGLAAGVHPVKFALEKCSGPVRARLLRDLYLRTLHPVSLSVSQGGEPAEQVSNWWNAFASKELLKMISVQAPDSMASLRPERQEQGSLAWCPRCLVQYSQAKSFCADCPGIELLPFRNRENAGKTHGRRR
jgi:hypothetical protein